MKAYFWLQYKMINRRFKDAGVEPLLAYVILTIGFFGLSIYLFDNTVFAEYIYVLFALALIGKLSETNRVMFLKGCFGYKAHIKIRIAENIICLSAFIFYLFFKQRFLSATLLLTFSTVLALVNISTVPIFTLWTPFSKKPFEFTIGFRNSFYMVIAAYALAVIAIFVGNFNLGIFALLLVFVTILSYYTKPEDEYYVWSYSLKAKAFLFDKIQTAIFFSSLLALPVALALMVFFYQYIVIVLCFILIGWVFLTYMIVSKYAAYPNDLNIAQGVFLALSIGFPPLLVILIPYLFNKSEKRLNNLLQ